MESARKTISEISDSVNQHSASRKDEVTVMKAMLNDPTFSVGVYDKSGKIGDFCPSGEFRKMIGNVVTATTKIPAKEARDLVDRYEFTKADAAAVIGVSKEFFNSYLPTGRKVQLGGRKTSNIELMWKNIDERVAGVPTKVNGERAETLIPAHGGIKAINKCPVWLKN